MIVISLPYLIYFIYKNWPTQNQMLPYFANQQKNENLSDNWEGFGDQTPTR